MVEADYYKILGIPSNAGSSAIKKRYQQLAKLHHPDHQGDENSMVAINRAYEVLSNSSKRLEYDHLRILRLKRRAANSSQSSKPATNQSPETKSKDKIVITIFVVILLIAILYGH